MDLNKLERLQKLKDLGALTENEFVAEKEKLVQTSLMAAEKFKNQEPQGTTYLMLMHLSQYANFITPFAGTIIPLIMWLINKDKDAEVDLHGRSILNWQLSLTLYFIISIALCFIVIGIVPLFALIVFTIIFPVIAGIKANDGEFYDYPLTINFLSVDKTYINNKPDDTRLLEKSVG